MKNFINNKYVRMLAFVICCALNVVISGTFLSILLVITTVLIVAISCAQGIFDTYNVKESATLTSLFVVALLLTVLGGSVGVFVGTVIALVVFSMGVCFLMDWAHLEEFEALK